MNYFDVNNNYTPYFNNVMKDFFMEFSSIRFFFFKFNFSSCLLKTVNLRETFIVKSTPKWFPHNVYLKSGIFKKCCIDCTPNSTVSCLISGFKLYKKLKFFLIQHLKVYYDNKDKNCSFSNLFVAPAIYQYEKKLENIKFYKLFFILNNLLNALMKIVILRRFFFIFKQLPEFNKIK